MTDPAPTTTASAPPPADLGQMLALDPPAITDAWPWAARMPLVGWLERNGFHPLWTAVLVLVVAFVLFQVVIAPLVMGVWIAVDLARSGATAPPEMGGLLAEVQTNAALLMTANTVGQWGGFALLTLAVARLHTPAWRSFLRIRKVDAKALALAALGWGVLYLGVIWTGQLNEMIPLPDSLQGFEDVQNDMLEGLLLGDRLSTPALFVALAITPAICEELLFRGYLQRQVERGWGTVASIVLVGIVFGAYHLRMSQLIPLSILGIYMGFVVWATGSLWAGVLVHLLNNGFAVAATAVLKGSADVEAGALPDPSVLEDMGVPWYLGVASLAGALAVGRLLLRYRASVVGDGEDSQPAASPPAPAVPSFSASPVTP